MGARYEQEQILCFFSKKTKRVIKLLHIGILHVFEGEEEHVNFKKQFQLKPNKNCLQKVSF